MNKLSSLCPSLHASQERRPNELSYQQKLLRASCSTWVCCESESQRTDKESMSTLVVRNLLSTFISLKALSSHPYSFFCGSGLELWNQRTWCILLTLFWSICLSEFLSSIISSTISYFLIFKDSDVYTFVTLASSYMTFNESVNICVSVLHQVKRGMVFIINPFSVFLKFR